jgi:hypothetical protein
MALNDLEAQIDTLRASAKEIKDALRYYRDQIAQDPALSPQGKTTARDEATEKARVKLADLRAREEQLINERLDKINRNLGAFSGSTDPSAVIAFRDAYDRSEDITKPERAMEVLERARVVDDKILAAAIMRRALTQNWRQVFDRYADAFPTTRDDVHDLRDLQAFKDNTLSRTAFYSLVGGA